MTHYGEKQKPKTLQKSERTGSCSTNCVTSYLSDFTCKITECSKQELTSYMCNITYPKFPSRVCIKNVSHKDKAVQCDLCELWVHIKCNNLNYVDYRYLQNSNESWYSIECCSTIFPFNSLSSNKNFLACCTNTDNNSTHWIDLENDNNSSLSLKPSSNLVMTLKKFVHPNIMTLKKCITLKYLRKRNHYPCFI